VRIPVFQDVTLRRWFHGSPRLERKQCRHLQGSNGPRTMTFIKDFLNLDRKVQRSLQTLDTWIGIGFH